MSRIRLAGGGRASVPDPGREARSCESGERPRVVAFESDERPRVVAFECGPDTYAIVSFPLDRPMPDVLSESERAVCRLLLDGASNAEIAAGRGTSVRTVANQVASILRKVGAKSRADLPRAIARMRMVVL